MKKRVLSVLIGIFTAALVTGCGTVTAAQDNSSVYPETMVILDVTDSGLIVCRWNQYREKVNYPESDFTLITYPINTDPDDFSRGDVIAAILDDNGTTSGRYFWNDDTIIDFKYSGIWDSTLKN